MATTRLLLGIICAALTCSFVLPHRHLLNRDAITDAALRTQLVRLATREIGVKELTGHNDGKRVQEYLSTVSLKIGDPWCAAFISFIFMEAGLKQPRTGWSPDMFPVSRLSKLALPGNLIGIYFPSMKRIAHVGMIVRQDGDWIISTEGNTNLSGVRDGDGVYRKRRHRRTIYQISDWVTERKIKR